MTPSTAVSASANETPSVTMALSSGDLGTALGLARQAVKASPADAEARLLLAELSLIAGDLEKADLHADTASLHRPAWAAGLAIFRAHLRGLHARDAFYRTAALPAFAGEPTERDHLAIRLVAAMKSGTQTEIDDIRQAIMDAPFDVVAKVDAADASAFSGLDDRMLHAVECIMASGDYVRIDAAKIERITFAISGQRRPKDLVLRPATVVLTDGGSAECVIPAIYPTALQDIGSDYRVGHATDWREEKGVVTGIGQVCWAVGENVIGLHDIEEIVFDAA